MPRILVVPFAGLALFIGIAYYFGTPERTRGPSYAPAKALIPAWLPGYPMQWWGLLFMTGFLALAGGIIYGQSLIGATLFAGGAIYLWWATLLAIACYTDPHASASAPGLYAFIGFAHFLASWRVYMHRKGLVM
jgi:hypothetical protein